MPPEQAEGLVKRDLRAAGGSVGNSRPRIVHSSVQSLNPEALAHWSHLNNAILYGASGITRAEKEMIATAVSTTNHCSYWWPRNIPAGGSHTPALLHCGPSRDEPAGGGEPNAKLAHLCTGPDPGDGPLARYIDHRAQAPAPPTYVLKASIPIPTWADLDTLSIDISWVNPATHTLVVADRSPAGGAIEVFDTASLRIYSSRRTR